MRETQITFPELGLIAGTRVALGAGLGLLLADRLSPGSRRAIGWTLFLTGALSTIPLALEVLGHRLPGRSDAGLPGGGAGRLDRTGMMPGNIHVAPDLTQGHAGYEESGSSELMPARG